MKRFTQTIAVLVGGCMLASGVQAGPLTKVPPQTCTTPVSTPVRQTVPPPLATPVAAPVAGTPGSMPRDVTPAIEVTNQGASADQKPRFCMVNTKLVLLSYEFKDVGPSGVSGVEVWYTRDGHAWRKFEGVQNENPVWVELEEGTFGIYLLAKTGLGGGKEPPVDGDQPHLWVQVDLTKPSVFLNGVHQSNGSKTLDITWTARDDNFGRKPISLYYAEDTRGPWMPIATGIENTGAHTWTVPPSTPSTFYVRVEAMDQAGNVDNSTSSTPVKIDLAQPGVTNVQLKPLPPK